MTNKSKILLYASETLSPLLIAKGITTWQESITYIQQLPYGRNRNRVDLSLVISEEKGTCSSKHAVLKTIAEENNIAGVRLIVGIYKMTEENTPGIGNHIAESEIDYIPEAHCYLQINEDRFDFTSPSSSIKRIEKDILIETEIAPSQVSKWKVDFHKQFIQNWLISEEIIMDFETIWQLREKCISTLSA